MNERDIYDPSVSVALSASAGSGKTHALTTRLLALLLSGVEPSEILAVTFTKSAAQDIRRKLFDRILGLESDAPGERKLGEPSLSERALSERALFSAILGDDQILIPERARQLRMRLIRQFSLLQISTIHSFFSKVLHSFPRETGFFGDLAIIDERVKRRFLRDAFERFYETLARDRELSARILDFLAHVRDRNLRAGYELGNVYETVGGIYHALRDLSVGFEDCRALEREHARKREALRSGELDGEIRLLVETVSRYLESRGKHSHLSSFLRDLRSFERSRSIRKLAGLTPFTRGEENPAAYIELVRAWLPDAESERFIGAIQAVRRRLRSYLESEMRAYACTYVDIYNRINRLYFEIKKGANAVDYSDLELLALDFAAGLGDFDYFAFRVGSRIRHVLIDEFQDTSLLQWEALKPYVDQAFRSGGSLFYVGDVKQSIYRWRGGEPKLFSRVKGEEPVIERSLTMNWRQNGLLLKFANDLFEEIAGRVPEFQYERQELPAEREGSTGGYLSLRQCEEKGEVLAGIIEALRSLEKGGVSFNDCAILCRTNRELEEVERLLTREKIPFLSPGRSRFLEDWAVQDVITLFRLVESPGEALFAAGLLRSPVFRARYDELEAYLKAYRGKGAAPSLSYRTSGAGSHLIEELIEGGPWLTPTGFLRMVYEKTGILDLYPEKREALLALYERAWVFEKTSQGVLHADFLEYLGESEEEFTLKAGEGRGVKLLTIHSAKGLEFHSVIVPFLKTPLGLQLDGSLLFRRVEGERTLRVTLARAVYRDYFSRDDEYGPLFREADLNARIDELNALYVALTRAVENLIILPLSKSARQGNPSARRNGSPKTAEKTVADLLVSACRSPHEGLPGEGLPKEGREGGPYAEEAGTLVPSAAPTEAKRRRYRSLQGPIGQAAPAGSASELMRSGIEPSRNGEKPDGRLAWGEEEPDEGLSGGMRKRRTESLKGLVVHKALEMVAELPLGEEEIELLLRRAMAQTGQRYTRGERATALEQARGSLRKVIADRRMADYFSKGAAREVFFLSAGYRRGMGRVDRVLIGNEIQVVDFKTNEIGGSDHLKDLEKLYRGQVVSYCTSLARIFPDRPVKGVLYFTDAHYDERIVTVYDGGEV